MNIACDCDLINIVINDENITYHDIVISQWRGNHLGALSLSSPWSKTPVLRLEFRWYDFSELFGYGLRGNAAVSGY